MFWTEGEPMPEPVFTTRDSQVYTHILYLDVPSNIMAQRWMENDQRSRGEVSPSHIQQWQMAEKSSLSMFCRKHGILFTTIHGTNLNDRIESLIQDFRRHSESHNLAEAQKKLDEVLLSDKGDLETVMVMNADRTLSAADASKMFLERVQGSPAASSDVSPLESLFRNSWKYSYMAFRQATLLYEAVGDDEEFDMHCQAVASQIFLYPEFEQFLHLLTHQQHILAAVITSGLGRVWEKVLDQAKLSGKVHVVGGGRVADGFVITPEVKAALVRRLRDTYKKYIWTFGDSPVDLPMMKEAHQAVVVVGNGQSRSKTMDAALQDMIAGEDLSARQLLLPGTAIPRLDTATIPVVDVSEPRFTAALLRSRPEHAQVEVFLADDKPAAQILATAMRDAAVAGPSLRETHRRVGSYLALEYLGNIIGLEETPITHVLGHSTTGSQLAGERRTIIVAMMRGGEPMAYGVNDILPRASLLHAKPPSDIRIGHLKGQASILLVDSVINTGQSFVEFVEHIRQLHPTIRIVVIAGVIQAGAITKGSQESLLQRLAVFTGVTLIGLRTSQTKFTGTGGTDTGNRLFNTTRLP